MYEKHTLTLCGTIAHVVVSRIEVIQGHISYIMELVVTDPTQNSDKIHKGITHREPKSYKLRAPRLHNIYRTHCGGTRLEEMSTENCYNNQFQVVNFEVSLKFYIEDTDSRTQDDCSYILPVTYTVASYCITDWYMA